MYDNRDAGVEGYADKTDDEIEEIIGEVLITERYSKRSRFAINNGVAANRKVIENFNPGEEYLFAVSLGKYEEGVDNPPEYKRSITYGTKVPYEYYTFSDAAEHNAFIYRATRKACRRVEGTPDFDKDITGLSEHPEYFLQHNGYNATYVARYNKEVS
jgi:hypothetical protein